MESEENNKANMNKIFFIGILVAIQTISFAQSTDEQQNFVDKEAASFEIFQDKEVGEDFYLFEMVDVNYEVKDINLNETNNVSTLCIAKYITTSKYSTHTYPDLEYMVRNIKVELRDFYNPQETILSIDKNCHKIELGEQDYRAIIYSCCAVPDYIKIFDYNHRPIIQVHNEIIRCSIPNSPIEIYIGHYQDSFLGTLHIAYNSDEKYEIKIKYPKEKIIPHNISSITIVPENDEPYYSYHSGFKNETIYELESLDGIKNKNQINGFKIVLEYKHFFSREHSLDILPIEIPIINGKPFGKDIKIQEVEISF